MGFTADKGSCGRRLLFWRQKELHRETFPDKELRNTLLFTTPPSAFLKNEKNCRKKHEHVFPFINMIQCCRNGLINKRKQCFPLDMGMQCISDWKPINGNKFYGATFIMEPKTFIMEMILYCHQKNLLKITTRWTYLDKCS